MQDNKENSVMRALHDLTQMESHRVKEENEREEQARVNKRRKEEELRQKEDAARKLAAKAKREQERRRRLEAELQQKDSEAQYRILSLKAELDAVQADREAMRHAMVSRYENLPLEPSPVRTVPLNRVVAGAIVLVAAVVGAFHLIPEGSRRLDTMSGEPMPSPTWTPEVTPPLKEAKPSEPEAPQIEPIVIKTDKPKIPPKTGPRTKKPNNNGRKKGPRTKPPKDNILDNFDKCGDDPMCDGLSSSDTKAKD